MARTPRLLLVVYETRRERLAFSIRTLRSRRHSLTVFRDYGSTRRIVFSVCLLSDGGEGICVHLLHGEGIPRCARDFSVLAIVLDRHRGIDRSAVCLDAGCCCLSTSLHRLPCGGQAFDWHWCRCVLRFRHVELPGSDGVVSAKSGDGGDCQSDKRLGENCSHLPNLLEFSVDVAV